MSRLLNGTTDFLEVSKAFAGGATPLSMGCWFNMTTTTLSSVIMGMHDGTANERFQLNHPSSPCNIQALTGHLGSTSNSATSTSASAGVWNHALGVWASATSRASYLNGGGKGTNATSRVPSGLNTLTIGARNGAAAPFDGMICEAAIWNVALSDTDAVTLSLGFSPLLVRPEALVAYWPIMGNYSPEINLMAADALTLTGTTLAAHTRMFYPRRGPKGRIKGAQASFVPFVSPYPPLLAQ